MITIEELCADNHKLVDENLKLRKENKELRDNYEQYKAVAEPEIERLKKENAELRIKYLQATDEGTSWAHLKSLEQENAELKEQNANLIAMLKSEREVRVNDDYLKGVCEKEAEIGKLEGKVQDWTSEYYELENFMNNKLDEAKKIIKDLLGLKSSISSAKEVERRFVIREKAEKFLEVKE